MTSVTLDWLHIVTLFGAAQGLLLAFVLGTQRANRTANRLLAVLMVSFSLYVTSAVYYAAGLVSVLPFFFGVGYPLPLLFGPLVYLYTAHTSDRSRTFVPRELLHFVPFVAVVAISTPGYLMSGPEKVAFYHRLQQGIAPASFAVINNLKFVSGIAYSVATLVLLARHRRLIKDNYSSIDRVSLEWLAWLCGVAAIIWVMATFLHLADLLHLESTEHGDDIVALAVALLVYAIGYKALRQPEIFNFARAQHGGVFFGSWPTVSPAPVAVEELPSSEPLASEAVASPAEETGPRYERSGLSAVEAANLKNRILATMENDHLYRNPDLTVAELARRLNTTPHKVSEVLNAELNQTFYDFVNGYRVEEVKRRLASPEARNLTLLALATDAGFASKSTFNSVFKKQLGQTPSEYRKAAGV